MLLEVADYINFLKYFDLEMFSPSQCSVETLQL